MVGGMSKRARSTCDDAEQPSAGAGDDAKDVSPAPLVGQLDTEDVNDYVEHLCRAKGSGTYACSCSFMTAWLLPAFVECVSPDDKSRRVLRGEMGITGFASERTIDLGRVTRRMVSARQALVIPMLFRGHYVLWIAHRAEQCIEFYDSLSGRIWKDCEIHACAYAIRWFCGPSGLGWWPWNMRINMAFMLPPTTHQQSAIDCGVFVGIYLHLRLGLDWPMERIYHRVGQEDVAPFRAHISRTLRALRHRDAATPEALS